MCDVMMLNVKCHYQSFQEIIVFLAIPGEYMQPFEDELKGNPSIEMMKQVVITAKKRPEFPLAFNVNPVS